jgi:hypothetical protein
MFQLIELIIASPIGSMIVTFFKGTVYAAMIVADCDECGFNDLGKLLFGGLILALLIGIAASILWKRAKEKNAGASAFLSIRTDNHK